MIEDLKKRNMLMMTKYKDNAKELEKYKVIEEILKEEKCFLKMDIEIAYSILRDLGVREENLKDYYCKLI